MSIIEMPDFETTLADYPHWQVASVERIKVETLNYERRQPIKTEIIKSINVIVQPRSNFTDTTIVGRYPEMTHFVFCKIADIKNDDEMIIGVKRYKVLGAENYLNHHLEMAIKEMPK